MPSVAMLLTINISKNLEPGYFVTSFPVETSKCMPVDSWAQLSQNTLNQAINQLLKRLTMVIKARGAHVKFGLDCVCQLSLRLFSLPSVL